MIQEKLDTTPDALVEFHCFNKDEAEQTRELLSPLEKSHVRFFWLRFD